MVRPFPGYDQMQQSTTAHQKYGPSQRPDGYPVEGAIRSAVEQLTLELASGYYVPRYTWIVAVADAPPAGAGICDDFRSRYAVDIELLGPDCEVDPQLSQLAGVPLPTSGEEMGIYAFPGRAPKW